MKREIRPARTADAGIMQDIAVAAGMFGEDEVGFIGEMLKANLADPESAARWLAVEAEGSVIAAAYYSPEPFADRMWNLYFIAVHPAHQGAGIGAELMAYVEDSLRALGEAVARTLIVETSSTAQYDRTRAFYRKIGYAEEARIRQFYGPDDDKIVFWRSLVDAAG